MIFFKLCISDRCRASLPWASARTILSCCFMDSSSDWLLDADFSCLFSWRERWETGQHYMLTLQIHTAGSHYRSSSQIRTTGPHYRSTLQVHTTGPHYRSTLQVSTTRVHYRSTPQVHTAGPQCSSVLPVEDTPYLVYCWLVVVLHLKQHLLVFLSLYLHFRYKTFLHALLNLQQLLLVFGFLTSQSSFKLQ